MMERWLQRKFKWTELPAVLAEGLLRLNGAGVELIKSVSEQTRDRQQIAQIAIAVTDGNQVGSRQGSRRGLRHGRWHDRWHDFVAL